MSSQIHSTDNLFFATLMEEEQNIGNCSLVFLSNRDNHVKILKMGQGHIGFTFKFFTNSEMAFLIFPCNSKKSFHIFYFQS